MKIARWTGLQGPGEGFIVNDQVVPFPAGLDVSDALDLGLAATHELFDQVKDSAGISISDVTLHKPLKPSSIRDFVTFEEHVEGVSGAVNGKNEVVEQWYEAPTFYFTNPHTVYASEETIPIPQTSRLDFELELAAVIGGVKNSNGENLSPDEAQHHIFGYMIMNDWSARDLQSREMKVSLGPCKGKDFGITLGPWIVTADEFMPWIDPDGFLAIQAKAYVNEELIGQDLVSNMGWTFPELVSYASRNSIVLPGDVLGSGTVGNGGCLGELWGRGKDLPPLKTGDHVRLVIEGVGEIINTVGEQVIAPDVPRARHRSRARQR